MRRTLVVSLLLTGLALAGTAASLLFQAMPATEGVRLRNSFIAVAADASAFDWTPPAVPAGFRVETGRIPDEIREFAGPATGQPSGPVQRAVDLATRLRAKGNRGDAIQRNTLDTFRQIVTAGGGYCADYSQVFNGIAHAANLTVREWGMSFDGFGGDGHAFNEVYDEGLGKWVMLDAFYGFVPVEPSSGEPLSALEFRERLLGAGAMDAIGIRTLESGLEGFRDKESLLNYYRRGAQGMYLWWSTDTLGYDQDPLLGFLDRVSRAASQGTAILLGRHPEIRILATPQNRRAVEALERTRQGVLALLVTGVLLAASLVVQLWLLVRYRRPS